MTAGVGQGMAVRSKRFATEMRQILVQDVEFDWIVAFSSTL